MGSFGIFCFATGASGILNGCGGRGELWVVIRHERSHKRYSMRWGWSLKWGEAIRVASAPSVTVMACVRLVTGYPPRLRH